jgi:predicted dinucleotide-binding enzyme
MSISIIGTGKVGSALAHVFARNHLEACVANTRGPESFPELAAEVGPTVRAVALDEQGSGVFLTYPFYAVCAGRAVLPGCRYGHATSIM